MRWSKEKIWDWYNARPWIRGCNYMSADCANRVDQWQELGFEERFKTTEEELKLVQDTGFNTVRLILEYVVWKEEHDGFMERFERYISLCAKYGISCIIVLANDCMPPKTELWKMPAVGEQHYDWGYHGGRKHSQHGSHKGPAPHFYLDDPVSREDYLRMVTEIVTKYKDDERIIIWDVYNEPGNSKRGELTLPNLELMFKTVRACDPSQPVACDPLHLPTNDSPPDAIARYALENSDIILYHCYRDLKGQVRVIKHLKRYGRPLICTEWLGRMRGSDVFSLFPLFYLENIGNICWGFVAGKYQTYEPWESMWEDYYNKGKEYDFTQWFHDLYRPSHRPYDPKEVELIQRFCKYADDDFARDHSEMALTESTEQD